MFFISKNNKIKTVVDSENKIVGFVINNRFLQNSDLANHNCDLMYKTGLSSIELEQVSEAIQNNRQYKAFKK